MPKLKRKDERSEFTLVFVSFKDPATQFDSWTDADSIREKAGTVYCATSGFLVSGCNNDEVVLVQTVSHDGGLFNDLAIPKGSIYEIKEIAKVKLDAESAKLVLQEKRRRKNGSHSMDEHTDPQT